MHSKKFKILHLDDERELGATLQQELVNKGYEAYFLQLKTAGVDWIRNNQPDLIVSDIRYFDTEGFEFLRNLQSDPVTCKIPFIFLTGSADLNFAMSAMTSAHATCNREN